MYPSFKILVVTTNTVLSQQIQKSLQSDNYSVETVKSENSALKKNNESAFNLVICQDKLKDKSGFTLLKKMEFQFEKRNTAFFLILRKYSKEDVQLGLEMGVDNFIFTPINPKALRNKVEKLYKKSLQFNYYETPRFQEQFYGSPIPMFFLKDFRIQESNKAFTRLFSTIDIKKGNFHFNDLFNLNGNQENHLNLRKLENGLIEHCWLDNVDCLGHPRQKCSLYKSVIGSRDGTRILTVLLPGSRSVADNTMSVSGERVKTSVKKQDVLQTADDSVVSLTPREYEILNLSATGMPLKQIAAHLSLSQRTVEKHRSNIMQKTETHSILEAILEIKGKR